MIPHYGTHLTHQAFAQYLPHYNCSKQDTDGHNSLETNLNFKIKINAVMVDWNYS